MTIQEKLQILADAAKYDASCSSSGSKRKNAGGIGNAEGMGICHSYTPDGRCVSLLKILLTNWCVYDCAYCVNRVSSGVKRAKFTPDEVVWLTLDFYRRNYIEGLFLSSGVLRTPDGTMDELIEVARSLRLDHKFGGYIHLKAVAGCSPELVTRAGLYSDRVSANIELPTQADLDRFAPAKKTHEIESSMAHLALKIAENREERATSSKAPLFAPGGQSTQMIVGATESPDREILQTASRLYTRHGLRRVYYSGYSPIPDSDARLPNRAPPLLHEQRLYQADWLIRFYGFSADEIAPADSPNLSEDMDPKLAWALRNPHFFPVDVNRASRQALLRVPGFGVRNVERILAVRRHQKMRLADLLRLKVPVNRAKHFVVTADKEAGPKLLEKPTLLRQAVTKPARQLDLFEAATIARVGEL